MGNFKNFTDQKYFAQAWAAFIRDHVEVKAGREDIVQDVDFLQSLFVASGKTCAPAKIRLA